MLVRPAARIWLLLENFMPDLHSLLKLLPGLLAFQPGYIPDQHPPGVLQSSGLGLHFLKSLWAELKEPVYEVLEDASVSPRETNTLCGWTWVLYCAGIRWGKRGSPQPRLLFLGFCWLRCYLAMVLDWIQNASGLILVQVLTAFTGQSCGLFIGGGGFLLIKC